jgi:hypothetical protein
MNEKRPPVFSDDANCKADFRNKKREAGVSIRPLIVTRFTRRHSGAQKRGAASLGGRCPDRVASKTSLRTLNGQRNLTFENVIYNFRRLERAAGAALLSGMNITPGLETNLIMEGLISIGQMVKPP